MKVLEPRGPIRLQERNCKRTKVKFLIVRGTDYIPVVP